MSQPRLSAERLAEIAGLDEFRPGFRNRLIGLFRAAVREHLPHCSGEGNPSLDQRRHAAHSLKGAALAIGASRAAALAHEVEREALADAPSWPDAEPIRDEVEMALELLEQWASGADISASNTD